MGVGWRFPKSGRTPPATLQTLCFVRRNAQILLLFRRFPPNEGRWNCPGGKVGAWESPTEACIREVFEETGLRILDPELRALITVPAGHISKGATHLFVYEANEFVGELVESREGMLTWFSTKYLMEDTEVVPDIPVLYRELIGAPRTITARLDWSEAETPWPRLLPDRPVVHF